MKERKDSLPSCEECGQPTLTSCRHPQGPSLSVSTEITFFSWRPPANDLFQSVVQVIFTPRRVHLTGSLCPRAPYWAWPLVRLFVWWYPCPTFLSHFFSGRITLWQTFCTPKSLFPGELNQHNFIRKDFLLPWQTYINFSPCPNPFSFSHSTRFFYTITSVFFLSLTTLKYILSSFITSFPQTMIL